MDGNSRETAARTSDLEQHTAAAHPANKRLDAMNRLNDLRFFPPLVRLGATANIAVTVAVTWWLAVRFPGPLTLPVWLLLVLLANLAPVALLRLTMTGTTTMPTLATMDFVRDQHKFSDWVYLAASANMAFWVLLSFSLSRAAHTGWVLAVVAAAGALHTFSPVLLPKGRK